MRLTEQIKEKVRSFFITRSQAYQQVFNLESVLAQRVLLDLGKFCRAHTSTFNPDPRIHAVLEGRREVWLRIQDHIRLDPEEFLKKYGRDDL